MKRIVVLIIIFCSSCMKPDCKRSAEAMKQKECLLIFEKLPSFTSYKLVATGKHLITKKECTCSDESRWWAQYKNYLEKGDTIIKRKGELIFSIHKKDTVLHFNWECEGKIYR